MFAEKTGGATSLAFIGRGPIQMLAGRQVGELLEVVGPKRFGNGMLTSEPLAKVYEPATLRAKRSEPALKPRSRLPASGAAHLCWLGHARLAGLV